MTYKELHSFLKNISFNEDENGLYVGVGQRTHGFSPFKIALFDNKIACFKENNLILFQIPIGISFTTFLFLCEDVGIIHDINIIDYMDEIEVEYLDYLEYDIKKIEKKEKYKGFYNKINKLNKD